jgi:hypothetical protein
VKRSIIAILAILPTVTALPAATQASSTGVVQLSSVTAGPVCDKFTLNGVVWAINSTEFNAGMRMSLILARALADMPVTVSKPSEVPVYGGPMGPDAIPCFSSVGAGPSVTFPNAFLIQ